MSVDAPESDVENGNDEVLALGRELGERIAELPAYQRFEEKSEAVEADDEAQERIEEFEEIRQEFMLARQTGEATQEGMLELKQAQQELHEMPVMAEFLEAREELIDTLEDLNRAISEPLELDFGKEAGGCCHDE
jgi:cell fate (sporulation/competence/biofilm development) regulator YlbF (YheA/YmcA/DUF963 family)